MSGRHIVTCLPNYLPSVGGAEIGVHTLLRKAASLSDHSFSVVVATDDRSLPSHEVMEGIAVHRFLRPRRSIRWTAPTIAALISAPGLIRRLQPDLVHASYALPTGPGASIGARFAQVPMIMTVGGADVVDPVFPPTRWLSSMGAAVARRATTVICFSSPVQDLVTTQWRVARHRTVVNPFGVDLDACRPLSTAEAEAVRSRWGLPQGALVGVAVQRLEKRKGTHVLVAAAERIQDPKLVLLIAGRGREEGELKTQVERAGLADRVRFLGFITDQEKRDLLAIADLHVLPSLYEGQGIVIAEAAACGTPSVATAAGGTVDMVDHGVTGWMVAPNSAEALAQALTAAISKPSELRRRGRLARRKAETELSLDVTAQRFLSVVEAALG